MKLLQKLSLILFLSFTGMQAGAAQQIENIVVLTTDGLRWQEVYQGMDPVLAADKEYNQGDSAGIAAKYWAPDPMQRRAKLLPFMWQYVAQHGQLYGNRALGNKVNVANPHRISSPGYSEIFTGFVSPDLTSNALVNNPATNVLEFINQQAGFKGKVAAFGAWEAFSYILNEPRSGVPVVAAFEPTGGPQPTPREQLLNQMLCQSFKPWGQHECLDVFTHHAAMEHLKERKPRVLYIAYGETDEFAHAGEYKHYLNAAHQFDEYVKAIWTYIQSNDRYKNKTLLFITTDHGRGDKVKSEWTSHGSQVAGAEEIWFAVLGPTIRPTGEVKEAATLYQKQFAQTLAGLLGLQFKAAHNVAESIKIPVNKK
ncbi:alkaline phosphatase family protein [Pontibacter liquoris]|uniref:alkaline phosphatase family protein n=1 Tax=Pontibacter liquoris TaxID=2905677 RepID=UPI001FA7305D|nr:alkaline phosphatase family protein [Pontibacter liquoris]